MVEVVQIAEQKGAEESERRSPLRSDTKLGCRPHRGTLKYMDLSSRPMVSPNSYMTCMPMGLVQSLPC